MEANAIFEVLFYLIIVFLLVKPLGTYITCIYEGKPHFLSRYVGFIETGIYRFCGIRPDQEMTWKSYLSAMLLLNAMGIIIWYVQQRLQAYFPWNPQAIDALSADTAFNNTISFATNTDWQAYSSETTLSYFTQMVALTSQNFLSAATGISILMALIRSFKRQEATTLGNYWVDMVRGVLYLLLPLSILFAIFLTSQGVIQNLKPYQTITTVQAQKQTIAMGPAASQVAISRLGSNGGGFFSANASHPFENPTPLTNFLEMLAILLIPAALCYAFGSMVSDKRQGWSLLVAMLIVFLPAAFTVIYGEQQANLQWMNLGIDTVPKPGLYAAGNMEGKETRFGIVSSGLWATATTATSNGSVNAMHDSFSALGGLVIIWLMHLGEVIFGGVGCGLYGMLMLVIITVFVAGLMVGRTPEYLGKKIQPYEMKMASITILVMPLVVLVCTAIAVISKAGLSALGNPGEHGFTEVLYAFTSMVNNNGSAFAGLSANTPFYNLLGGMAMLFGRYWIMIPILAIAGSLARKKFIPASAGTLSTHTPLFVCLLISVIVIIGALTFFPALALGPIAEQFSY